MKKAITLKDLALKMNMSVSTVSKALNDDPSISDMTRTRVKKLAAEWHYIPNEAARHFKLNKSFTLGIIMPDLMDQFYILAINGIEKIAAQHQYNVIISQTHEDAQREEEIADLMLRNRVDGVIVVLSKNTQNMDAFRKLLYTGIPLVFFARAPMEPAFNFVSANNEEGATRAVDLLFKRGHKRIAHLMGPHAMPVSQTRLAGYKKALAKNKLPFDSALVKEIDFTPASTFHAMRQLMKMKSPPTAIFVFKNYVSLDAINFLKNHYPGRLKKIEMVGFGNLPLMQYMDHKPIASIEENSYAMGVEAAELIFRKIEMGDTDGKDISHYIQVPCKLVMHH